MLFPCCESVFYLEPDPDHFSFMAVDSVDTNLAVSEHLRIQPVREKDAYEYNHAKESHPDQNNVQSNYELKDQQ